MKITLNGKIETLNSNIQFIEDLLHHFELINQRIAVEVNGKIISRGLYQQTLIESNDKIEIIKAVGGG